MCALGSASSGVSAIHDSHDHIELALEASCGMLVALEWLRSSAAGPALRSAQDQQPMNELIEAAQAVIGHLRAATGTAANIVAYGFIGNDVGGRQVRPRRTA
jgi:hypothetical protein